LTIAHNQANTARNTANDAYGQANLARTQANTAYGQANLAYTAANSAANTTRVAANTNSVLNAVGLNFNNTATVNVSVGSGTAGNANISFTVNTTGSGITTAQSTAQAAYGQANLAYAAANSAANTVRVSQNGASSLSARQLNFVNTSTVTISVTDSGTGNANIAFNAGGGTLSNIALSSNGVFATNANAFNFINTESVQVTVTPGVNGNANISFSSVSGSVVVRDNFTGDGNTVNFTLSTEPLNQIHTLVFVDLVFQSETAYSISGSTLTFTSPPSNGSNVDVYIYSSGAPGSAVITSDIFSGTGACTTYQLSQTATTSKTFVYLDGVSQRPDYDYQVVGTTLSFNVAPANATVIQVRSFSPFDIVDINVAPVSIFSDKFTGTGSCTQFTLTQTGTTDSTFVFLNGVSQKPGMDYAVGGVGNNVLTMTTAPANGSVLEVRSIGEFKLTETQSRIESNIFTGDGNTVTFAMSAVSTTKKTFAFIDGVSQKPFTDYTVIGNNITFSEAPPDGTFIEVRSVAPFIFATSTSDLAYDQANLAFTQANSAYALSNLAYNQANNAFAAANNRVLKTGDTMTGNLTFSGSGLRFIADMSNATISNRFAFQTNTPDSATTLLVLPSGTGTNAQLLLRGGSAAANDSFGQIVLINNTEFRIASSNNLAGIIPPMTFQIGGIEHMRISNTGNVGIGTSTPNSRLHVVGTVTLEEVLEKSNISATAMGANVNFDVLDCAVVYYTANTTANSTLNIRGNTTVNLNSVMSTNQALTIAFAVTTGATAHRVANVQIDGTTIVPKWSGGSAPTASANSIDVYSFTVFKTGSAAYTVLGSKTQFA
jgi:hypothetical protein